MTSKPINDGGPAFPVAYPVVDGQPGGGNDGMTLRDYFAAKALSGMIASAPICDRSKINKDEWSVIAYDFADAMLAARESSNG